MPKAPSANGTAPSVWGVAVVEWAESGRGQPSDNRPAGQRIRAGDR